MYHADRKNESPSSRNTLNWEAKYLKYVLNKSRGLLILFEQTSRWTELFALLPQAIWILSLAGLLSDLNFNSNIGVKKVAWFLGCGCFQAHAPLKGRHPAPSWAFIRSWEWKVSSCSLTTSIENRDVGYFGWHQVKRFLRTKHRELSLGSEKCQVQSIRTKKITDELFKLQVLESSAPLQHPLLFPHSWWICCLLCQVRIPLLLFPFVSLIWACH